MKETHSHVINALEKMLSKEVEDIRIKLLRKVEDHSVSFMEFLEACICFWQEWLDVDRIFVTDMRTGAVVAGWNKGKNIINLQDWDEDYVPLDNDSTLQEALVSDQLVASPTPGVGADMAFSMNLSNDQVLLVALDQTNVARTFSELDMAYIGLVRDLAMIKARMS